MGLLQEVGILRGLRNSSAKKKKHDNVKIPFAKTESLLSHSGTLENGNL
jgi:hypothetical protein